MYSNLTFHVIFEKSDINFSWLSLQDFQDKFLYMILYRKSNEDDIIQHYSTDLYYMIKYVIHRKIT